MFDVACVGHFALDSIFLPGKNIPYIMLGGSAAYVSLAAKRLDARVSVVSKVGEDFPEAYLWWLGQEGIDLSRVAKVVGAKTTRYELHYSDDFAERVLSLKNRAPLMTADDFPESLRAKAIHVAPIAGEIEFSVAERLKRNSEILSMDPQGFVRSFDEEGNVVLGPMSNMSMLEVVDIFKASSAEIQVVTGLSKPIPAINAIHDYGVDTVIVTFGTKGAILSVDKTTYNVPAYTPTKVVDPTGAGDAFVGAFLAEYVRGEDAFWCACVGSSAASTVVEGVGPTSLGDREEICQRARGLYEKGLKQ